jgi:protein phosphatase
LWRKATSAAAGAGTAASPWFETAARSHVGTVRSLNEDRLLALEEAGLWVIADGMGGHHGGDVAAQSVIDEIARAMPDSADRFRAAIDRVNRRLIDSARHSQRGISGSTVVGLLLRDQRYLCLWMGDSEVWLFRDGEVRKLTRDHSVVEEMVRAGIVAEADRRSHPHAHVITRAVGVAELALVDVEEGRFQDGDLFLLCSDGLTGAVAPDELARISLDRPIEAIAEALLQRALVNGASDNVTFILVRTPRLGSVQA